MRVTVFGIGYVGLVQAAVLAEMGHKVICVDVDADKVAALKAGHIPLFEPGLAPLVLRNHQAGRLIFTTDPARAVEFAELIFIAVGTPPDEDGSADLHQVMTVADTIGRLMQGGKVVVNKSTVPSAPPAGYGDTLRSASPTVVSIFRSTWFPTPNF